MKKILLFLICFLAILIIPKTSYSQTSTPTPTITNIPMPTYVPGESTPWPGLNCGDSTSEEINRCCYNSPIPKVSLAKTIFPDSPKDPTLKILIDRVIFPVETLMDFAMKAIFPDERQMYIDPCVVGSPSDLKDELECLCIDKPDDDPLHTLIPLCDNIKSIKERKECQECFGGKGYMADPGWRRIEEEGDRVVGVWTGVGCIYANPKSFIEETVFGWGIGLAGTIALFCIIYSAFQIQISQGNPEKLKKAQEMLTSCIVGLMLLIFSVFILKVIGVDILKIPF